MSVLSQNDSKIKLNGRAFHEMYAYVAVAVELHIIFAVTNFDLTALFLCRTSVGVKKKTLRKMKISSQNHCYSCSKLNKNTMKPLDFWQNSNYPFSIEIGFRFQLSILYIKCTK